MEENYGYQFSHRSAARPSRLGLKNNGNGNGGGGGGEIVEVEGGHIVRATGLKDRHSKVCTAKGPRDRRVRLSAHTAIQFYDVQDRLGYDRPSKAVDWLIKKAKASIDELAELPAWTPTAGTPPIVNLLQNPNLNPHRLKEHEDQEEDDDIVDNQNSSFLPAALDSVKSFFPSTPAGNNDSSGMQFHQNYPPANQDLELSLQSFQDPIPHHQTGNNIYFDHGSGWPENSGFVFNSPPTQTTPLFGQPTNNQLLNYISQRGPLQSSNSPPVRAWFDPAIDHHQNLGFHHPSSSMLGFSSGAGGFRIPARIQCEEEEHDDKPSSASSDSRY